MIGLLAYFKNEKSLLHEWIQHHQKWGFDYIWLIDNGSEDNYNINEFSNVEVFKEPNLGQIESYRKYFHSISDKVDWLGVVDVDEFIYSKSFDSVKEAIKSVSNCDVFFIRPQLFAPGSFYHPKSIIEANTKVIGVEPKRQFKCIVNTKKLIKENIQLGIHGVEYNQIKNTQIIENDSKILTINHYRWPSFEMLYGIKEQRGGGVHKEKYKKGKHKFVKQILYTDTYLKEKSREIISKCETIKPSTSLYKKSSWNIAHIIDTEKMNEFKNLDYKNYDNVLLVNSYFNNLQQII